MSVTVAKTNLAKLLAQENLIVESRNVETAYFELNTRTLVLPELKKDISPEVQDLFISHECSHGLHTPTEEWNSAVQSKTVRIGILNVVEDARIESLIKRKYPGLKAVYAKAYNKLMEVDFFGLSKLDIETLNFVDRLNLYCKVGFIPGIEFSDSEQVFVNRTENTKSFAEVVQLSKDIEEFIKKDYEENLKNYKQSLNFDDFKFEQSSSESESEDLGEEIRSEFDEFDEFEMDSSESEQFDDFDSLEDLLESFTDEHSKEEMKSFYANDNRERYYVTLPDINVNDYIVSHQTILTRINDYCPELFDKSEDKFVSFKNENIDIVSYLAKEFNLKKNASARKKLKIAKTGDLNNNKLYSYRFNDDLFKRSVKINGEKSHSMIFYLDWSGSMSSIMQDTIKQLLCLVLFCKKVNIPYEVYAFTSEYDGKRNHHYNDSVLQIEPLRLLNLFTHKMTNKEFISMANILLSFDYHGFRSSKDIETSYFGYRILNSIPMWFQLGSTPLNHSIILSDKISKKFKALTKTDIVSNIFLTDGESHGMDFLKNGSMRRLYSRMYTVTLRDNVQKSSQNIDIIDRMSETNGLLDFVKQTNDTRYFGFRLSNFNGLKNSCFEFFNNCDYSKYWGEMKKSGCVKAHKTSFDEFFFVRPNLIKEDKDLDKVKETDTVNSIFKQFSKSVSGKHNNRIFLKKFIEFIS